MDDIRAAKKLIEYLPPIMQQFKEMKEITNAEDKELLFVQQNIQRCINNSFISTSDEYGIGKYEFMLGIYPSTNDTLESRRSRIQSRWEQIPPYTLNQLKEKLNIAYGEGNVVIVTYSPNNYTIDIKSNLELFGQLRDLIDMLKNILPCNMIFNVNNKVTVGSKLNNKIGIIGQIIPVIATERG